MLDQYILQQKWLYERSLFFLEETETYHYYINISIISYYFHLKHRGLNRFHRGHAAYILLYTNKGCNDQRSQATTSSVSGLKKILKNHTFKQYLLSFASILIYLSDETSFFTTASPQKSEHPCKLETLLENKPPTFCYGTQSTVKLQEYRAVI